MAACGLAAASAESCGLGGGSLCRGGGESWLSAEAHH